MDGSFSIAARPETAGGAAWTPAVAAPRCAGSMRGNALRDEGAQQVARRSLNPLVGAMATVTVVGNHHPTRTLSPMRFAGLSGDGSLEMLAHMAQA